MMHLREQLRESNVAAIAVGLFVGFLLNSWLGTLRGFVVVAAAPLVNRIGNRVFHHQMPDYFPPRWGLGWQLFFFETVVLLAIIFAVWLFALWVFPETQAPLTEK